MIVDHRNCKISTKKWKTWVLWVRRYLYKVDFNLWLSLSFEITFDNKPWNWKRSELCMASFLLEISDVFTVCLIDNPYL